jgi:hypothetical protein
MSSNRPACEMRLGHLKAVVWANETSAGIRHSVTFARLYRKEEQWEESSSFNRDDLLLLGKLADQVHTWICEHGRDGEQDENPAAKNGQRRRAPAAPAC